MEQHLERLDGLASFLRAPARQLIDVCEAKLHRSLLVVRAWSSIQDQALNYQKGRAINRETGEWEIVDESKIVTRAKPGLSAHNVISRKGDRASMALDVVPLFPDGTADWNIGLSFWTDLYELAWKAGLDPLGDPVGSYLAGDRGHFEEPAWKLKLDGLGLIQPVTT